MSRCCTSKRRIKKKIEWLMITPSPYLRCSAHLITPESRCHLIKIMSLPLSWSTLNSDNILLEILYFSSKVCEFLHRINLSLVFKQTIRKCKLYRYISNRHLLSHRSDQKNTFRNVLVLQNWKASHTAKFLLFNDWLDLNFKHPTQHRDIVGWTVFGAFLLVGSNCYDQFHTKKGW